MSEVTRLRPSSSVRSQELDDESPFPPLRDADNLGLVSRPAERFKAAESLAAETYYRKRADEVSLDPELLDEYEGEPLTWASMSWRERAGVVLVLALVGLVYVAIVRALRG